MKIKKLTTAVALAAITTSGAAVADNHASEAVKTALANAVISGEAYGGYWNSSVDNGTTETDTSDFDLDLFRLGLTTTVKEDVEFGPVSYTHLTLPTK